MADEKKNFTFSKRNFLRFAGISTAVSIIDKFLIHPALAGTWTKVGEATGTGSTWQKIRPKETVSDLAIGGAIYQSGVLRSDGRVFGTGYNTYGGLGDNTAVAKSTYVQAIGISNAVQLVTNYVNQIALRSDGNIFGAGINAFGELGDNSPTSRSTFVQALGISSNARSISGGAYHTMAVRADGKVYGTGYNAKGALGDNTTAPKSSYIPATGISNAVQLAAGYWHSVALRADGNVFASGYNDWGGLGDNTTISKRTFVQALGISNAVQIAVAGGDQISSTFFTGTSIAIRADGKVFGTGGNLFGQIGDNTTVSKLTYVQAIGISNAVAIACGYVHTVALRSDGNVFAAGLNLYGQLGDNTVISKRTFVQAVGISNAIAVACNWFASFALRSDGLVFGTGFNGIGAIADNTTTSKLTFVQAINPY